MDTQKIINEWKAQNILLIAKQHKEFCHDEYCGVNLFMLKDIFEQYIGRQATDEEFECFM